MHHPSQLEKWGLTPDRQRQVHRLRELYEMLAKQLFHQYEASRNKSTRLDRDFLLRLEAWLSNLEDEEDRWTAFRAIEYLFFAGQHEFDELYRCAYEHIIKPWIIDECNLDIFATNINALLQNELGKCWPCPITDSLKVNSFLHVSGLRGQEIRPDWLSLSKLGDSKRIADYAEKNKIKYLILIEDFVGSGSQFSDALAYAASAFSGPILAIPLIVCAPGDLRINSLVKDLGRTNVTYKPVLVVTEECLVGGKPSNGEPKLFPALRKVMKTGYAKIGRKMNGDEFGWEGTGSLVVLYSNCPNNTPPIFHAKSKTWTPLFSRSGRA